MLIGVTGTGTEVGKTWVTAATIVELRQRGVVCAARKPAQSFDPSIDEPTDADVLAAATGELVHEVCASQRWLRVAMAPPMAASALGLASFSVADLITDLAPNDADVVFVEGAGGLRSPLASDGDTLTMMQTIEPDLIVVVGDAELGTINSLRLTVDAITHGVATGPRIIAYLNRFQPNNDLHERNQRWLIEIDGFDVVTSPIQLADGIMALLASTDTGSSRP